MKYTIETPVYKKDSRNEVQNYHPVSILSNLSKVYEKCLFNEMATHFDDILSKYQCGFSCQQYLIVLLEKWEINRDKDGSFTALLTDLSKTFDCLLHDLLIAKLHSYSFDMARLKLIYIQDTHREKAP